MRILVAMDSFKGSASSLAVGQACAAGIRNADPTSDIWVKGLADGGDGTLDVLIDSLHGRKVEVAVHDAYGKKIQCSYGVIEQTNTAVIEIAQIVGLPMDQYHEPLRAGTYGVGEMILHCLKNGYRHLIVGLGGSSTNDGGMGMLQALGVAFYDINGHLLDGMAANLSKVERVSFAHLHPLLKKANVTLACDVKNPLCGKQGATYIFGPQKGVSADQLENVDQAMNHYGHKVNARMMEVAGAGAAGGLGFALMSVMSVEMKPGIDLIMEAGEFEKLISQVDLVISGEGRIDAQTAMGKGPGGLAKLAKQYHKPMILLGGSIADQADVCHDLGITAYFSIQSGPVSLSDAMDLSYTLTRIEKTAEQLMRFYLFHV